MLSVLKFPHVFSSWREMGRDGSKSSFNHANRNISARSIHLKGSRVKQIDPSIFTKSGLMVGLGETGGEVRQVMADLRSADVDFITIGQFLQPTPRHHEVMRFVTPDEFKKYERLAYAKGFLMVSATPLTRSSYFAGDDFAQLRANRQAQLAKRSAPGSEA